MDEDRYQEGYDEGYESGYADGSSDYESYGYDSGYDEGHDAGYEAGMSDTYTVSCDELDRAATEVEDILIDSEVFGLEITPTNIIAKAAQIIRSINLE